MSHSGNQRDAHATTRLDRLERWVWQVHRLDPVRLQREQPLRAQLLQQMLIVTAGASLLYLALGILGLVKSRIFPFDALEMLAAVGLSAWLSRRGKVLSATTLLPVVMSHPVSFLTATYGLHSPAGALFLPTILVCGLLIGRRFLITWTVICCLIIVWIAVRTGELGASAIFWWGAFVATGWLVSLFSRHLERLLELTRQSEERRRAAIVEERTRIAREIHDTLAQGFTGIVIQLNAAEQVIEGNSSAARQHLERARTLARTSLEEARRSVMALRPEALDQADLRAALEHLARQLTAGTGIQVETRASGEPRRLSADAELNLLRISQEAITNAVRHAEPKRIVVHLSYEIEAVRVEVHDDGSGIASGHPPSQGFGLTGMRERAEQLGGRFDLESQPGRGTTVTAVIPLR
jgi:signal transduction histidine kinase